MGLPAMRLNRSVVVQERAVAADGVETFDLPVNPISHLMIAIRPLNDTGTLSNYCNYLQLVDSINRISILHRGASVLSLSGVDLACLNYLRHGIVPREANPDDTDNERRCVILPVPFGRMLYDPDSCFPGSRRGELVCELDIDVADTGYDNFRYSVEAVEIIGAKPKEFERKAVISRTFPAVGPNDVELPLGNKVRGIMLFGTTSFTGAVPAPSWGRISMFLDNEQLGISGSDWEVGQADNCLLGRQPPGIDNHTHRVPTNAGAFEETTKAVEWGMGFWDQRIFYDFDPTRDDLFSIDTSGAKSFVIQANAETADAVRVLPIEQIPVKEGVG